MIKVFNSYSDPGHGWARVPLAVLRDLAIADKITTYSYMRGEYAYLEEDCDVTTFFNAYRAKYGFDPVLRHRTADKRSKIRGYNYYRVGA